MLNDQPDTDERPGDAQPFVLHVRTVTGFGGGPEKTILNSPRHLPVLGYRSSCAYLHPADDPGIDLLRQKAEDAGAELISVVDSGALDTSLVAKLAAVCQQRNVKIWHAHDDKTNLLGLLVRRRWPMKLVTTAHGWVSKSWKASLHQTVSRFCLRFYDMTIAVSPDIDDCLQAWGIDQKRRCLIENAIDTDAFRRRFTREEARDKLNLRTSGLVLAGLGRLEPEKGFDRLIAAVGDCVSRGIAVTLLIGGDGSELGSLRNQVARLGLADRVSLLGHLSDPRLLLQAADVFVLSSLREGLPNVVLEAMALETPVISTRVAGIPRLIESGEHGLLIDIGDHQQMVAAIGQLEADKEMRQLFALHARKRIEDRYDFKKRMQKVASVYDQVLSRGD